jgi:hypothetical protein
MREYSQRKGKNMNNKVLPAQTSTSGARRGSFDSFATASSGEKKNEMGDETQCFGQRNEDNTNTKNDGSAEQFQTSTSINNNDETTPLMGANNYNSPTLSPADFKTFTKLKILDNLTWLIGVLPYAIVLPSTVSILALLKNPTENEQKNVHLASVVCAATSFGLGAIIAILTFFSLGGANRQSTNFVRQMIAYLGIPYSLSLLTNSFFVHTLIAIKIDPGFTAPLPDIRSLLIVILTELSIISSSTLLGKWAIHIEEKLDAKEQLSPSTKKTIHSLYIAYTISMVALVLFISIHDVVADNQALDLTTMAISFLPIVFLLLLRILPHRPKIVEMTTDV